MTSYHAGIGLPVWVIIATAATSEIVLLVAAFFLPRKAFAIGLAGLTSVFFAYHCLEAMGYQVPCKCLGAISAIHPWISRNETKVALVLCFALMASAGGMFWSRDHFRIGMGSPLLAAFAGMAIWIGACSYYWHISSPMQIAGDEALEVAKALSFKTWPERMATAWNDQSLAFTILIAVGDDPLFLARCIAVVFGSFIPFGLSLALDRYNMQWAPALLGPLMLLSPSCAGPMVRGMLEIPALGLGCLVAVPLFFNRLGSSIAAGFFAGVALAFKPTSAFAILLVTLLSPPPHLARFGFAAVITSVFTLALLRFDFFTALASHSSPPPRAGDFSFQASLFTNYPLVVLVSAAALFWVHAVAPRRFVFAVLGYLAVAFAIHIVHSPFWDYYSTHLALGFCLVIGAVVTSRSFIAFPLAALIGAGVHFHRDPKFDAEATIGVLGEAKEAWGGAVQTVVSQVEELPYMIGATPVPEACIFPTKRFWAGEATVEKIAKVVSETKPDLVCLDAQYFQSDTFKLLMRGWHCVGNLGPAQVWTSPRVPSHSFTSDRLKSFGL